MDEECKNLLIYSRRQNFLLFGGPELWTQNYMFFQRDSLFMYETNPSQPLRLHGDQCWYS
jgi:hypothetical protein